MISRLSAALLLATGVLVLGLATSGDAQTACPVGTTPGSAICGPSGDGQIPTPPRPTGEWIKTWGAIATSPSGNGGVSSQQLSEGDAKQVALRNCTDAGNAGCVVEFTYRNQCVAAVRPPTGAGGQFTTAATIEGAKARALRLCKSRFGSDCIVVISECSDPVFRKF